MSGNSLQYGLIGLGALAIVCLIAYNLWQEYKTRKHAEQAFRSTHHDVLLDGDVEPAIPPGAGGRMEPALRAVPQEEAEVSDAPEKQEPVHTPPRSASAAVSARTREPVLADDLCAIDCAVSIEAPAGVSASALYMAQQEVLAGVMRRMVWYGWNEMERQWFEIDASTPGSITRACVTLQLGDRRGTVGETELDRFYQQLQRVCEQFLAVPRLPARTEVLAHAAEIDRFCAEVDIQIAVNVIAQNTSFSGTKLRGLAEAAGLVLGHQGVYLAPGETGMPMFMVANHEAVPFTAEQLRHLQTHGLSFVLDLPRTLSPLQAFDRMVVLAGHFAESLGGLLVDDNKVPLTERSLGVIRNQLGQFELEMERQSIPAGSDVALRLFS